VRMEFRFNVSETVSAAIITLAQLPKRWITTVFSHGWSPETTSLYKLWNFELYRGLTTVTLSLWW
jgi:hypothetical protein